MPCFAMWLVSYYNFNAKGSEQALEQRRLSRREALLLQFCVRPRRFAQLYHLALQLSLFAPQRIILLLQLQQLAREHAALHRLRFGAELCLSRAARRTGHRGRRRA